MSEDSSSLSENSWMLKVTDRDLTTYEKLGHFDHKDIPPSAKVLNIGSGLYQTFEANLKTTRPDIAVVSVDPSLVEKNFVAENTDGEKVIVDTDKRKQTLPNKENTISAIGQKLPFPDNSFDLALDIHGPAQYSNSEEIYKKYLNEAVRVLKPGGKLHIFNTYYGDPLQGNPESEKELMDMQKRILSELGLKNEIFLETERIVKDDSTGQEIPDKRVGVIITK